MNTIWGRGYAKTLPSKKSVIFLLVGSFILTLVLKKNTVPFLLGSPNFKNIMILLIELSAIGLSVWTSRLQSLKSVSLNPT